MKRAIIILLSLVFSSKLYAVDPKTFQYVSATQGVASGGMTTMAAIDYFSACGPTFGMACAKGALASLAALTSFTMAGLSLQQAEDMDGNTGASLPSQITVPLPKTKDGTIPTLTVADLRKTIAEKEAAAKQLLDQFKAKGYDAEKIIANPEAFGISKDQLKQMQSEVAQAENKGNSLDSEEAMKTIFGDAYTTALGTSTDVASVDASISMPEAFNMDALFGGLMSKEATENSAPGYYGNVSLKVLNPTSKMSLFDRVSSKIKTLM